MARTNTKNTTSRPQGEGNLVVKVRFGPKLRELWPNIPKHKALVLSGPAGTGKALSLSTLVPTPHGWQTMGSLRVGDSVLSKDGTPTRVMWKSPVMQDHPCYSVEFSDGTKVIADAEHLWEVRDLRITQAIGEDSLHLAETQDLFRTYLWGRAKRVRYAVDCCEPAQLRKLPTEVRYIDPYVLGAWLGDGDSRDGCFTSADEDVIGFIRDAGFEVTRISSDGCPRYCIRKLKTRLRIEGLLNNKHIPGKYLHSGVDERISLLQGLMDTDGYCCGRQGTCEFCTTLPHLADQVYELVCSLGIKATIKTGDASVNGRVVGKKYRVCFTTSLPVFRLRRKLNRLPRECRKTQSRRYIIKIRRVRSVPVCCIRVDREDGIYLVTKSYLPTHNTRFLLENRHLVQCKYPGARGLIVRRYRSSMAQSCIKTWEEEVLGPDLGTMVKFHARDSVYKYQNGSEVVVAGMDDPTKILSSKYDWFFYNEIIEGKQAHWEQIATRLRSFKVPYQQALGDTNPGSPSHWIKKLEKAGKLHLLETTHRENPFYWDEAKGDWTPEGKAYVVETLGTQLSGIYYKRFFLGQWVAAEGAVYDQWNEDVHVVPRFTPDKSWPRFWVFDFGYIDPLVWQEWVESPVDGSLYLHRELYHSYMRVEEAAEMILDLSKGQPAPRAIICDHDAENRADLEKVFRRITMGAYKAIHPGIQAVQSRMLHAITNQALVTKDPTARRAAIYLMENASIKTDPKLAHNHRPTCTKDEMECYVWDTSKMALDKYKDLPVDKDNHGMDAMRYMVAFADNLAIDPQDEEEEILLGDEAFEHISTY